MSATLTGDTPNWVAGYVPPAAEWNQWWSRKMDTDSDVFTGAPFVSLGGGTMSGPLYLEPGAPTQPAQAVPKSYVDSLTFAAGPFMPTSGGTFTGPVTHSSTLTLMGNPVGVLDAAPKQYVDAVGVTATNGLTVANAAVRRAGDTMTGLLILSADPVNVAGAATKRYADTKLALAGGTITGSLVVNGSLQAISGIYSNSTIFVNAFNGWEWALETDGNGNKIQTYRSTWYDIWISSNGTRAWVGGNANLMTLDGAGNLNVTAQVSANVVVGNAVNSNGNASIAGTQYVGAIAMGPWVFYNNGDQIQQHTTGWYDQWVTANGTRNWVGGNVLQMSLDPSGSLNVHNVLSGNQIYSNVDVAANGNVWAYGYNMYMGAGGAGMVIQMSPTWYWEFNSTNGNMTWVIGNSIFWQMRPSDNLSYNGRGPVGGVGPYYNFSDERAKENIIPARCGLAEVLKLQPIEFTRTGGKHREIGFSAQRLRAVIPLAVRPMFDIDTDDPSLSVAIEPVIAALVNGMKQLAAEIADMKGWFW